MNVLWDAMWKTEVAVPITVTAVITEIVHMGWVPIVNVIAVKSHPIRTKWTVFAKLIPIVVSVRIIDILADAIHMIIHAAVSHGLIIRVIVNTMQRPIPNNVKSRPARAPHRVPAVRQAPRARAVRVRRRVPARHPVPVVHPLAVVNRVRMKTPATVRRMRRLIPVNVLMNVFVRVLMSEITTTMFPGNIDLTGINLSVV